MGNPRFSEMKRCFLGTFGIIESAMKIPFRNPNFIILTLITSFPLFSLTLLRKLPFDYQPTLIYEAIDLLRSLSDHAMTLNVTIKIIEIYLFNLVNFLIVLTTIHAASSIYTSNVWSVTGLQNLLRNSVTTKRWHGCMLTWFNISLLCSLSLSSIQYWHYARPLVPSCCPPRHFRLVQSGCPTRHSRFSGLAMHWIVYGVGGHCEMVRVQRAVELKRCCFRLRGEERIVCSHYSLIRVKQRKDAKRVVGFYASVFCWKVVTWVLLTVYYYDCKKIVLLNSEDQATSPVRIENITLLN
ncbi:hypothetical protein C1H46_042546 [Malus baccata]|uniref:Uncharacterized protein n=1 Tax=Malus baccata TaxID=106549 RepID=A0A540KCF3_MALBA|nr:hypothetical protein C1H46_042546 [Malus baccata]